ncbi:tannase/feruloyl esterase family alpha/beta hydrolase [Actinomadura craniellae]|uniref:Tannase/feruloyl esterase family alpha/beta hydrolase n=1 Tax=Actinomadura craniellae TaxID=2231787 RepID=A0A365H640_9ACTN|nr:tannase/feruloyl esterase family alpha/beta hydrolase [Actinomadura craniellae]RAY13703.1 tannase/feruloyl esterase family alpha/beta hydrolase [Actinomadura craniellae]
MLLLVPALLATALAAPAAAGTGGCPAVRVPGAEHSVTACLTDLTTAGTVPAGRTDPADWAGLEAPGTVTPSGVPGVQVDGYFPDTSTTNTNHGWNHDAQFVIRLPKHWNGGLVVAGPPATREQYANDRIISDQVLARGYAYAATDKGNTGPEMHRDGRRPGDAIMEWHHRLTQLTRAARRVAAHHYGRAPRRTYAAGLSAGGYLVRWQLEHHPSLYDGGLDWNALVFTAAGPNLLTTLPPALRAYPRHAAGDAAAHAAMLAAGYPAGSEPVWDYSHRNHWDFFQRLLREEVDPGYDGDTLAGTPFCPEGTGPGCDTDYDYRSRPPSVHRAMARVSLTGRLTRPLVSVQGSLDALTPPAKYGDHYHRMVAAAGRAALHRLITVPGGTHTDGMIPLAPDVLRPMLPSFVAAFAQLEARS